MPTSIHGHNYRALLTFRTEKLRSEAPLVRHAAVKTCLRALHDELDHRYLNEDVVGLKDRPITTESLAGYIYERVKATVPLHRICFHKREDYFAEICSDHSVFLVRRLPLPAALTLH